MTSTFDIQRLEDLMNDITSRIINYNGTEDLNSMVDFHGSDIDIEDAFGNTHRLNHVWLTGNGNIVVNVDDGEEIFANKLDEVELQRILQAINDQHDEIELQKTLQAFKGNGNPSKETFFRVTFRSEVTIKGRSLEDAKLKFEYMSLYDPNSGCQYVETTSVEDIDTNEDLTDQWQDINV